MSQGSVPLSARTNGLVVKTVADEVLVYDLHTHRAHSLNGVAAAVCPAFGGPGTATLEESATFLRVYEQARGRPWSVDEWQVCWAAGLKRVIRPR